MTFTHDGIVFDLAVTYRDVTGVEWQWTGDRNTAGEPLMGATMSGGSFFQPGLLSLPDLYAYMGPLIPSPSRATAAIYRRVLIQADDS